MIKINSYNCVCGNLSTIICAHPDCELTPFVCNISCSQNNHTHNGKTRMISMEQFLLSISDSENCLNPQKYYENYFETIKQKALTNKNVLHNAEYKIEQVIKRYKEDIIQYLKLNNNQQYLSLLNKAVENKNGQLITGKQIGFLINKQNIFRRQNLPAFEAIKQEFDRRLSENNSFIGFVYLSQKEEKSKQIIQIAKTFTKASKYSQALVLYNQAKVNYDFNSEIYFQSAVCYRQLNKLQESIADYKQCFKINNLPDTLKPVALFKFGHIYESKAEYEEAIRYFSLAIQLKGQWDYFVHRAFCYQKLNKPQEAKRDGQRAKIANPNFTLII